MTEAKPTPKPRSAFLPILLLMVGLAICAGVGLAFVPLVECEACLGMGVVDHEELIKVVENRWGSAYALSGFNNRPQSELFPCEWCAMSGRTTALRKLTEESPPGRGLSREFGVDVLREIKLRRSSAP